jgi:hypothetical protein
MKKFQEEQARKAAEQAANGEASMVAAAGGSAAKLGAAIRQAVGPRAADRRFIQKVLKSGQAQAASQPPSTAPGHRRGERDTAVGREQAFGT